MPFLAIARPIADGGVVLSRSGFLHVTAARLVSDQRREKDSAKRMKNDDVTLMRLRMLAGQPAYLLACR